mgnify:CR=1 FL=1
MSLSFCATSIVLLRFFLGVNSSAEVIGDSLVSVKKWGHSIAFSIGVDVSSSITTTSTSFVGTTSFIFNFDFEDEYNYSSMLYDIKQEIISKDNKPYREIVYHDKVLSTTKFYPTDNHENGKTVTNQYFFDKEVNLIKNIKLEEMYFENDEQRSA